MIIQLKDMIKISKEEMDIIIQNFKLELEYKIDKWKDSNKNWVKIKKILGWLLWVKYKLYGDNNPIIYDYYDIKQMNLYVYSLTKTQERFLFIKQTSLVDSFNKNDDEIKDIKENLFYIKINIDLI